MVTVVVMGTLKTHKKMPLRALSRPQQERQAHGGEWESWLDDQTCAAGCDMKQYRASRNTSVCACLQCVCAYDEVANMRKRD